MQFELKGALKKYRRMRLWRRIALNVIALCGLLAPWFFNFGRTDTLICLIGSTLFWICAELEMRLKTMQIRLAGIDDKLDEIGGKESENSLILELNDW